MSTQAEKLKNEGNVLFKKGDYKEAAALYSRAIQHAPTTPSFFTNRALCYLHMQSREQVGAPSHQRGRALFTFFLFFRLFPVVFGRGSLPSPQLTSAME
eukprot:m.858937 g.858937  ORF g.858937 m.858937 type:complete len:99 (+) comp59665_c0_seq3:933-1229(+)